MDEQIKSRSPDPEHIKSSDPEIEESNDKVSN